MNIQERWNLIIVPEVLEVALEVVAEEVAEVDLRQEVVLGEAVVVAAEVDLHQEVVVVIKCNLFLICIILMYLIRC